jgi:hypothetical protein
MSQSSAVVPPRTSSRWGTWVTVLFLGALTALLLWRGYGYYRQHLDARAVHPDHRLLSPAGFLGHGYGMVGTLLIATNLLYLVRRRFTSHFPAWAGSMKAWLNAHAFTGLVGSVLIVFHSAFQLRTPIATVTAGSLAIVVVTGLVGLYLHALVPKAGLKPLKERLEQLEPLMPGLVKEVRDFVARSPVTALPHDASLLHTVVTVPRWVFQASRRRRGMRAAARKDRLFRVLENTDRRLAREHVRELGLLAAAEVDTQAGAAFMRSWRSLHRFLAILMLASVSVHIGVAWYYGFRWIFE